MLANTQRFPLTKTHGTLEPMSDTISFLNDKGLIETVNIYTGETVAIQSTKDDILKSKQEKMVQVQMPDGSTMWLEKGLNIGEYIPRKRWSYSEIIIDLICTKLLEGKSLRDICKEPGMPPYHILSRWRRSYPEVDSRIKDARHDYAEILREQVVEEALAADEDSVQTAKVRMDALKWAAGVDNPDRYGNKAKVAVEGQVAMQLLVDTGIRRPEDEAVNAKTISGVIDGEHQNQTSSLNSAADTGSSGNATETVSVRSESGSSAD